MDGHNKARSAGDVPDENCAPVTNGEHGRGARAGKVSRRALGDVLNRAPLQPLPNNVVLNQVTNRQALEDMEVLYPRANDPKPRKVSRSGLSAATNVSFVNERSSKHIDRFLAGGTAHGTKRPAANDLGSVSGRNRLARRRTNLRDNINVRSVAGSGGTFGGSLQASVITESKPTIDRINPLDIHAEHLPTSRHVMDSTMMAWIYATSLRVPIGVKDIDSVDKGSHLDEPSLALCIMRAHQERELSTMASSAYLDSQPDISRGNRRVLVDWQVDVHARFKMTPQTLYLAVNIVDRFLNVEKCVRSKLQLVGVTAMWLASKYEEIYPARVDEIVYVTANTYTREQVFKMEGIICNSLKFNLTIVSPLPFVTRTLKALQHTLETADVRIRRFAHYMLELSLCYDEMIDFRPSLLAATAVALAASGLGYDTAAWDDTMRFYSGGYTTSDLEPCVYRMWKVVEKSKRSDTKTTAVRRKYSKVKFGCITKVVDELNLDSLSARYG